MSNLIFDKYEIIRRLALGGMGEVFLAREMGGIVDRLIILKSLLPELAEQDGFIDQFLDEARVAATLNHPNIVSIYEVGLWHGVYFIAMEHIHGGDLSKLQRTAGKQNTGVPFQVSARIILDACLGLHHAHEATDIHGEPLNIVHRDISPQNIMVRGDGVTKVVDFGIAKASNRETRTATGLLKGKLQYMPPEQVRGEELDGRSDQFSLGVVLWEMCTGRRLFKANNELETLKKVLNSPIPRPSELVDGFPEQLESVILRMLARDPDDRFPNCNAAADYLKAYLDSCSRQVGPQQVSAFVKQILGDELTARTSNLEPSKENFVLTLGESGPQNVSPPSDVPTPTASYTGTFGKKRSRAMVASIGVVLALLLGGALAWSAMGPDGANGAPELPGLAPPVEAAAIEKPKPKKRVAKRKVSKKGTVEFEIEGPAGAEILVDGKPWPKKAPTILKGLKPGPHKIELIVDGTAVEAETLEVPEVTAKATLALTSSPVGAVVKLEGQMLGKTPFTTNTLPPGVELTLELVKKGFVTGSVDVTLKGGEQIDRHIELEKRRYAKRRPAPAGSPAPEVRVVERTVTKTVTKDAEADGYLTLNTTPWSKVSIDGSPYGSTPIFKVRLSPGTHKVVLENENLGVKLTKRVKIGAGKTVRRHWKLK
jgi:serine/threonine protein kinase